MAGEISPPITAPLLAVLGMGLWDAFATPILVPMPEAFGQTVDIGFLLAGVAGYLVGFAMAFAIDALFCQSRKDGG